MDHHTRWADGGYKSRKMWFAAFCVAALFGGLWFVDSHNATVGLYDTFVGGVVAIAAAYITGNLGAKWAAGKAEPTPAKTPEVKKPAEDELPRA